MTAALEKTLAAAFATLALAAVAAGASLRPATGPPLDYYLALGDSLAFGLQPDKVDAGLPPSGFRSGYVDLFAVRLRTLAPKLRVVNYGCPGESTTTFTRGGCPWLATSRQLHDGFRGSQLSAALAFLHAHRGRVSPITVTLWANDVTALANACGSRLACVRARAPAALAAFGSRLSSILEKLRTAAPDAEIIVTGSWNGEVDQLAAAAPLYRSLDSAIAKAAAGAHARFASVSPEFNPQGSVAKQRARLCALTFTCSKSDSHPTDAGYAAIAAAVWKASGYSAR